MINDKKLEIDAASLKDLKFVFCAECEQLIEKSDIILFDPESRASICKKHKDFVREYKLRSLLEYLKKDLAKSGE